MSGFDDFWFDVAEDFKLFVGGKAYETIEVGLSTGVGSHEFEFLVDDGVEIVEVDLCTDDIFLNNGFL